MTSSFRSHYLICPCFFVFIHISHLHPESIWGSYLSNQLYDGMIERIRNCRGVRGQLQQSNDGSSELPSSQGKNGNITSHWVFIFSKKEYQFSSVQSLSRVRLFETPWTAVLQASLSISNSQSLLKLTSIETMMPSNHLTLCHPLLPPSIFPNIRVFSIESVLRIRWPKCWHFSFSIRNFSVHILLKLHFEDFKHFENLLC